MWFFVSFCTQEKSVQRKIRTKNDEFLRKMADLCNFFTQKNFYRVVLRKKDAVYKIISREINFYLT